MNIIRKKLLSSLLLFGLLISINTIINAQSTVVEDFETGDFSAQNWQFEGTQGMWEIENFSSGDGEFSASANAIAFNDYVTMSVTKTFTEAGQITFDILQTENNIFIFEVDGYLISIAGWLYDENWRTESFDVSAGTHTIKFTTYNIGNWGETFSMKDSLFLDNITFPNQLADQTAYVQVIHNSSDVLAETVDVYLDNELVLDNFKFRSNTPFIDLPAGEEILLSVKGSESTFDDPALWSQTYILDPGERYIFIAEGLIGDESDYNPYIPFDIAVYPMAEQSTSQSNVNILVHHGSTDAPTVDVIETGAGAGLLVDDLSYSEFSQYLDIPVAEYQISIFDETGVNKVSSYYAPLNELNYVGKAITVIASGFLNTEENNNGAEFGLYVALPDTNALVELPILSDLDGRVEDFESGDFSSFNWRFEGTSNAWQITEASNGSGNYAASAKHTAFNDYQTMFVYGDFEQGGTLELDMLQTYNGSVTIFEVGDYLISYSQFEPNPEWNTLSFDIPSGVQRIAITNYVIGYFGESWSGQRDSVLIDNIRFNASTDVGPLAKVQIIHNSTDIDTEFIDIWLNDKKIADNLKYRSASTFLDIPASEEITISVSNAGSISNENPLWSQTYEFFENAKYIMVANGNISSEGITSFEPFDVALFSAARENAIQSNHSDILFFHGSADAPSIDIYEGSILQNEILSNLDYFAFEGYMEMETLDYVIELTDASSSAKLASFDLPLETMGFEGNSLTILSSGFMNPELNNDGAEFGLYIAHAGGGDMVELPRTSATSLDESLFIEKSLKLYPNPVTNQIFIDVELSQSSVIDVFLFDITGRTVKSISENITNSLRALTLDLSDLPEGVYLMRLNAGESFVSEKIIISR
jgi:hypothetical protein